MPCPDSWYQFPAGVMPASFQTASSFLCVPESSPRETKRAFCTAIALKASTLDLPFTPAGSPGGPTMTKSLCITSR